MNRMRFEWDGKKEKANIKKHSISFDEASTAFSDENATQFFDPDHSQGEDRFILLGISFKLRVLVVCHCFSKEETVVRIISARKAYRGEESKYWRLKK
ncbi:MAG: BrnT family toxin [Thermodesulfobacteriota bacterium]